MAFRLERKKLKIETTFTLPLKVIATCCLLVDHMSLSCGTLLLTLQLYITCSLNIFIFVFVCVSLLCRLSFNYVSIVNIASDLWFNLSMVRCSQLHFVIL